MKNFVIKFRHFKLMLEIYLLLFLVALDIGAYRCIQSGSKPFYAEIIIICISVLYFSYFIYRSFHITQKTVSAEKFIERRLGLDRRSGINRRVDFNRVPENSYTNCRRGMVSDRRLGNSRRFEDCPQLV